MRPPKLLQLLFGRTGVNDFFLAVLFFYMASDMNCNPNAYNCDQPIRAWLLGTCAIVATLRIARLVSNSYACDEIHCLFPSGFLGSLVWPVLAGWAAAGTMWTWRARMQSKLCLMEPRHLFLVLSWLAAVYTWLIFHAWVYVIAWQHARHLEWIKNNLRAVENGDVRSRWGNVSEHPVDASMSQGLTAEEISAMPSKTVTRLLLIAKGQDLDCSICLGALRNGDYVRPLDACGHTFHRACIDLWLLRRAECPLCKTGIGPRSGFKGSEWIA